MIDKNEIKNKKGGVPIKRHPPCPEWGDSAKDEEEAQGLRVLFKVYHKFFLKVKMSRSRFVFEIFKKLRKNLIF